MKKLKRVTFFTLTLFVLLSFIPNTTVHANEMSTLEYEIELQTDGSGIITETREMSLTRDTEIYIDLDNLGASEVIDFQVSDFGEPLTYEPDWDIHASRKEKAGKYGMVETSDGVELAWGIGEYGEHEYTVTYTITNMVRQLEDGQGMNWQFFEGRDNINPEQVAIRISGPEAFTPEDTKIWGFGFEGEVYLEDGELVGWSNQPIGNSNYITILMQFLNSPFTPEAELDQTLNEQQDLAMEGSSYNEGSSGDDFIFFLVFGIVFFGIFFIIFIVGMARSRAVKRANPLVVGRAREKMNEDQYYRNVPYQQGSISDVAYFLQKVSMGKMEDYFNAYMLKWLKEERISIRTEEAGRFIKKEQTVIKLDPRETFEDDFEDRFWKLLVSAADADGVLYDDQLRNSAKKDYKKIQKIDQDLTGKSEQFLINKRYIEEDTVTFLGGLTAHIQKGTTRGETLFNQLIQFKNYLNDFSLLGEREMREVALWDDLLVWASLYGIADQVAEQLERFFPTYFEETQISYTDIYMLSLFSRNMATGYSSGVNAASGGGGSTSIGGGGGSFGGGGGGSR